MTLWELSKKVGKKTVSRGKSGKLVDYTDPITGKTTKADSGEEYWRAGDQEEMPEGKGDMQYMNGIMWCQQERAKIVGLYAPKKVANTDPTGEKEAGVSAKEELLGMMAGIVKRMKPETPEEQSFVEGVIVNQLESDNSVGVDEDDLPELAKRLNRERMRRLPAATTFDENGAIVVEAEEADDTKSLMDSPKAKLGE